TPFLCFTIPPPPRSTPFPYTTLFRSPTEAWRAAAKQLPTGAAQELAALAGGPTADPGARPGAGRGEASGALRAAHAATALADDRSEERRVGKGGRARRAREGSRRERC